MVEDVDAVVSAEKPVRGGCTGTVHKSVTSFLDFLDLSFSKVLMLVVGFTTEVLDGVHTKDLFDSFTDLGFGVIAEECVGGTVRSDKIFQGVCHFMLGLHRKDSNEMTVATTV